MLNFFRKNAQLIGWAIVIFFVSTMLSGALFFYRQFKAREIQQKQVRRHDYSNELALIGNIPVNQRKYMESLRSSLTQFKNVYHDMALDPELAELIQFNAFNQAVQYTILLEAGKNQKMKVTKTDVAKTLENVYRQFNLKDNKALKKFLKKNNYPYKLFIEEIKKDVLAQKYQRFLASQASVTDKDIENNFSQIKARHILFKADPEKGGYENALTQAKEVQKKIQEGLTFEEAAKKYSDDLGSKENGGLLDWFGPGETIISFEETVFALNKDEISNPVKTSYGFHLIKLLDKKITKRPEKIDYKKLRNNILKRKQESFVSEYIQTVINQNPIAIIEPSLKAFDAKKRGDYSGAINAYQSLISQSPSSPIPHYLLGQVHLMLNEKSKAKRELLKAEIKGEMNPVADIPAIHIYLGNFYLEDIYSQNKLKKSVTQKIKNRIRKDKQKDTGLFTYIKIIRQEIGKKYKEKDLPDDAIKQYDKAFEISKNNPVILKELESIYSELKAKSKIAKIKAELDRIKKEKEELKAKKAITEKKEKESIQQKPPIIPADAGKKETNE